MLHRFAGMVFAAAIVAVPAAGAPLEAYGHLPAIENVAITPDGKVLAFTTIVKGMRVVAIYSLDESKAITALNAGEQKLRDLRWADNDHLLITISSTTTITGVIAPRSEYFVTEVFDRTTGDQRPLIRDLPDTLNISGRLPTSRTIAGHTTVFVQGVHFQDERGVDALFSIDLESGRGKIVEPGSRNSMGWLVDEAGNVTCAEEYNNDTKVWNLKLRRGDDWTTVYSVPAAIDLPTVLGITGDGKSVAVKAIADGRISTKLISLSGDPGAAPQDLDAMAGEPIDDPSTHRLIGTMFYAGNTVYRFEDREDQLVWNSVLQAFPGENVTLMSWDADRKRVVVLVDGLRYGSQFQLVDLDTHQARVLGSAYEGIGIDDVAEVKFIHYKAADETVIPAFLTLPSGRPPKNLPLVVFPHGGPLAQDYPGFDWWAQAMASRGYAVLQSEYRGSDGFGWAHAAAGFGQWGLKMQTDLSDGVRYLAGQGIIDPKRVCIVGASYGGYAALAGPTLDRGVYRCAVSVAGVSDPQRMLRWVAGRARGSDTLPVRFWTRFMGVTDDDDPKLATISPLVHAGDADAPILLIHGTDDTVVPISQSEDMEDALKTAGKPVTFVKLHSEDHWLSRAETREQMLAATVQFLEQYNPPN